MVETVLRESEFLLENIKGILTLTTKRLYFKKKKGSVKKQHKTILDIPLSKVRSVSATKESDVDKLIIEYDDKDGTTRTIKFSGTEPLTLNYLYIFFQILGNKH